MMTNIFGENLFDAFFEDFGRPARRPVRRPVRHATPAFALMKTDVKENEAGYEFYVELPGYKKEEVSVELKDGALIIKASKNTETEEKDKNEKFIRRERFHGSVSRSFYVGEDIEENDIKAKFEDGILKLFVPKKAEEPKVEERKFIAIEG